MSWYRVVVVNEDARPMQGITVEAVDLTARAVVASVVTNRSGEALFTGLTGPQFFRPRVRRTAGQVGDKTFTGRVMVQIVGMDALCYDFIVDGAGGGTHLTLALAVAAGITLAGTSGTATIWMCSDVTEKNIDIGGLGSSAHLIIYGPDRVAVTITADADDIFIQGSTGGEVAGSLRFHNIGFSMATGQSVLSVETASELDTLEFDRCLFAGGELLSKTSTNQIGNVVLSVSDCIGTLAYFYDGTTGGGTHSPDSLNAYNNKLTLTNFWLGAAPDETRVQGGRYVLGSSAGITFVTGESRVSFQDLFIVFSAANALFDSSGTSNTIDELTFQNIVIRITNSSGTFGDFGSAATNNNDGLFIKNIYGFGGGTGTFITVDTDYLNVHVGNLKAKGFTTLYTGPSGVGDDHGFMAGLLDDDHTIHPLLAGRSGGQTLIGGTASGEDLTLQSTSNATRGSIFLGSSSEFEFGEVLGQLKITSANRPQISAGVDDTSRGLINIYGHATGSTPGGRMSTYMSADYDGTDQFWFIGINEDDFFIDLQNAASIFVLKHEGQLQLSVTGSGGGIRVGGDSGFYRSAPNVLRMLSGDDLAFDDNDKLVFGTGSDAVMYYDGVDLIIEPDLVGVGELKIHGEMEILHVASENDAHSLEIETDAAGFANVKSISILYTTSAISAGEDGEAILVNIDENAALGGHFSALEVLTTTTGELDVEAVFAGVGVSPMEQLSGQFANPDSILVNAVDELSALTNAGSSTSIFVSDNDTMTVGSAARFESIEVILSTESSGAGIAPVFEFSTGVGTWTAFSPTDGTNGMRNTGIIVFETETIPTWAVGTGSEFLIRITRTRNSLSTTPVADFLQISATTECKWDDLGNVTINNLIANLRTYGSLMAVPEIGFGAQTVATLSGNELTDITRGLATQGDGRDVPDSSFGVWEATTNLIANGGMESNTTGWATRGGGGSPSVARDTNLFKFGAASLKCVSGTSTFGGLDSPTATVSAGTQITVSFWIYRTEGAVPLALFVRDESGNSIETSGALPLTKERWFRFEFTTTTLTGDTGAIARITKSNDATNIDFYIDGLQIETQPIATPYVETDGGTASRSDARVRLPVDLDESVGWIAVRLRAGWTSTGDPSSNPVVWQWRDDDSNMFELRYDTANNQWDFERINGGSSGEVVIADAYTKEDYITLVAAWTATTLRLSLDGGDFVSANDTNIPTLTTTTVDVGSHIGSSEHFDSDIVWMVGGKGTLTDLDVDGFDANTNRPPRRVDLPTVSVPTLGWDANSGALAPDILLQDPNEFYVDYVQGTLTMGERTTEPSSPAAGRVTQYMYDLNGHSRPFWKDQDGDLYAPPREAMVVIPRPVDETGAIAGGGTTLTTTNAEVQLVCISVPITIDELQYIVSDAGSNADNVVRLAMYSEDGQTRIFNVTDAVGTGTGTRTVSVTAVTIAPGNYYTFFCLSSGTVAGPALNRYTTNASFVTGGAGENDLGGDLTITGGAAPSTFDPTAITTPGGGRGLVLRLDGNVG